MQKKWKMMCCAALAVVLLLACVGCTGLATVDTDPTNSTAEGTITEMVLVSQKPSQDAETSEKLTLRFDGEQYVLERTYYGNRFVRTYDLTGKLLLNQRFLGENLNSETAYFYDAEGKRIRTEGFGYDEVYTTYRSEFTYDEAGNLIRECDYINDELFTTYVYSADGKLLEHWSPYGSDKCTVYTYGEDGKLQRKQTTTDGQDTGGAEYTYDDQGRLIREQRYTVSSGKRKELTNSYTYDDAGRCVRYDMGGFQGEQSYEEYTYDSAGNMLSSTYYSDNGDVSTYRWTYDDRGNMLSIQREGSRGYEFALYWSFDAQGNVTAMNDQGRESIFCYEAVPEELPAWLKEEIAVQILGMTHLEIYTPEVYTALGSV